MFLINFQPDILSRLGITDVLYCRSHVGNYTGDVDGYMTLDMPIAAGLQTSDGARDVITALLDYRRIYNFIRCSRGKVFMCLICEMVGLS